MIDKRKKMISAAVWLLLILAAVLLVFFKLELTGNQMVEGYFSSYAPIDDPKIVVVVYVQNGYAGSHTAKAAWTVSDAYLESLEEKESTVIANENSLAE